MSIQEESADDKARTWTGEAARAHRWNQVLDSLVEAEVVRRESAGKIIPDHHLPLIRGDFDRQAEAKPRWKQQQIERHFGEVLRPQHKPMCPHCEIVFDAGEADATLGGDGQLYCRASCARLEPFVGFGEALRTHPEWAEQLQFVRNVLERRGLGGGKVGLASIASAAPRARDDDAAAGEDIPF